MGQNGSSTTIEQVNVKSESAATTKNYKTVSKSEEFYNHQLLKRHHHVSFDVENWYPILRSATFYTEFISISPAIAQAFVNYYQTRYNSKKALNLNDLHLIQSMQHKLKQQILTSKNNLFQKNGCFIRLSSRSPKDGKPLDSKKLIHLYDRELRALQTKYPHEYDSVEGKANMELIAYCHAQFHSLRVINELEALNIILSSERVFIDLLEALDCEDALNNKLVTNNSNIEFHVWNTNIIIREWNVLLDPSMEFRCFVYQSNLTAISQYNHYCKFYHLQNITFVEQIKTLIIEYWQHKIKPFLESLNDKYLSYIVDIGLVENGEPTKLECVVIELNPFQTSTGASLFDWTTDIDQLTGKTNNIEMRIRSDYFPNITEYMKFIADENQLNIESDIESNVDDHEPFNVYLNRMQTQISS